MIFHRALVPNSICGPSRACVLTAVRRFHYGVVTERYSNVDYWSCSICKRTHELRSVYDQPEYAVTQKELHTELKRLRSELKVPEQIHQNRFLRPRNRMPGAASVPDEPRPVRVLLKVAIAENPSIQKRQKRQPQSKPVGILCRAKSREASWTAAVFLPLLLCGFSAGYF